MKSRPLIAIVPGEVYVSADWKKKNWFDEALAEIPSLVYLAHKQEG